MEKHISMSLQILSTEALNSGLANLRNAAIDAAKRAYAPYSEFHVGAAVLLENGVVAEGNNQENVAYPSGLCAERVALFAANATYPEMAVEAIAVVALKKGEIQDFISPCGSCRQVLLEVEKRYQKSIKIYLCGKNETRIISSAEDLLPLSFNQI
jgi:cytidine deaminase